MALENRRKLHSRLKLLVRISIVIILIIGAKQLDWYAALQSTLQSALVWIQGLGPVGVFAYILIYTLATVLFIPGSLLTLGGGAIYGPFLGSGYVFVAAMLGATIAFLLGRYAARGWVSQQVEGNVKFRAIDEAVAREGFKIVLLTRLSPVFPFNLLNYAFGVTNVSLRDYVLGSVGILPGTILYVYIGSVIGDITALAGRRERTLAEWILYVIGLMITGAVTVYITRIARNALDRSVASGVATDVSIPED
ncbi:MAG: TVP38/TMEM64 family protein [Leptolyngbyaceae cyanobacterium RU_5_1]|nr:TVP38/TMEM64 family protein [Leptolyngbyaceae cyanobacterium RU_5_1]